MSFAFSFVGGLDLQQAYVRACSGTALLLCHWMDSPCSDGLIVNCMLDLHLASSPVQMSLEVERAVLLVFHSHLSW